MATAFLEVARGSDQLDGAFHPPLQMLQSKPALPGGPTPGARPQLLFDNALRHLMQPWLDRQKKVIPRVTSLERIYLAKAIKQITQGEDQR